MQISEGQGSKAAKDDAKVAYTQNLSNESKVQPLNLIPTIRLDNIFLDVLSRYKFRCKYLPLIELFKNILLLRYCIEISQDRCKTKSRYVVHFETMSKFIILHLSCLTSNADGSNSVLYLVSILNKCQSANTKIKLDWI